MTQNYTAPSWVVFLDDDLSNVSDERAKEIGRLTISNMVVVAKCKHMTEQQEVDFCKKIGNIQHTHGKSKGAGIRTNVDGIMRVTAKKDETGEEGLFGHTSALDWHANQTSNMNRMPLIWLYGAEGTQGSRTSWINMIEAYNDLDDDFKEEIKDIQVYCGYERGKYSPSEFFKEHVNRELAFDLVHTNDAGQTGLYFPFLQIFEFAGEANKNFDSVMSRLKEHVLQEKFIYHHDWEDGDIVISEQWLSIHKRWEFEHMDKRVLHRIAFDYKFL